MRFYRPPRELTLACLLTLMFAATLLPAQLAMAGKGGKPGKGGSNEPSAPLYAASVFTVPDNGFTFDSLWINESLQVAGMYRILREDGSSYGAPAFYDPLIHGTQAIDVSSVVQGLPEGFEVYSVSGFNDQGMMIVTIRPWEQFHPPYLSSGDPDFLRLAGLIDTANGFQFHSLPDLESNFVLPLAINNSNDVILRHPSGSFYDTDIVSFDPATNQWLVVDHFPNFAGSGLSDHQENGDWFLLGTTPDGMWSGITSRLNLGTGGTSDVALTPIQIDKNSTYNFYASEMNRGGDFLGILKETTERTRRGETTSTSFNRTFLFTNTWEDYYIDDATRLNDDQDFLSGSPIQGTQSQLHLRDRDAPIVIMDEIDVSTAPEIDWANTEVSRYIGDLTDRVISDDGNPANDLPALLGREGFPGPGSPRAFILTPIVE